MIVHVLMENTPLPGFIGEHGLSFHITMGDKNILLDAGSSGKFVQNAEKLGISLADVHIAILSHGHYDHGDGFRSFFQENSKASLYLRKDALGPQFSTSSGSPKFVGLHKSLEKDWSHRFHFVEEEKTTLWGGIYLINHQTEGQKLESALFIKEGWDHFTPDHFYHQQSLVFQKKDGLIVFNSCCHGGASTVLAGIRRFFPDLPITLVGGLHLSHLTEDCKGEVQVLGDSMITQGIQALYTGHCTGPEAYHHLQPILEDKLHPLMSGQRFELEF